MGSARHSARGCSCWSRIVLACEPSMIGRIGAGMNITEMSSHHLDDVAGLCERELVLDRDAGSIPGILMRRQFIGLVAVRDSGTAGACIGSVSGDSDEDGEGFIDLLVVDRASQRQGVGRQLLNAMERRLAARGCEQINLAGNGPDYA